MENWSKPHIALVGRPNVGKSTLFNALLGRRRAITAPQPGVTRDVITESVCFSNSFGEEVEVWLSDTAGILTDIKGPQNSQNALGQKDNGPANWLLNQQTQHNSLAILQQADLVLWVVALDKFNAEDAELRSHLQTVRDKVLLVVNKVDTKKKEIAAYSFYEHGFPNLAMVSALQRQGLEFLRQECVQLLSKEGKREGRLTDKLQDGRNQSSTPSEPAQAETACIRFTLIGKPNTGKSTLYNILTGTEAALVSSIPGTTRDVLSHRFVRAGRLYELSDTAGVRRKNKVRENVEYYSVHRAIQSLDHAAVAVLLVDSREGIQQQDKKIAQQIIQRGRGLIFALNKVDLLAECGTKAAICQLQKETRDLFPRLRYAPICCISALSGRGTAKLLGAIGRVHQQLHRRVGTGLLNQALQDWLLYYPVPSNGALRFKVRYLTQVEVNPLRFILFVNRSKGFPQSYVSFLQNQLRKELGFADVPLHLHLRE